MKITKAYAKEVLNLWKDNTAYEEVQNTIDQIVLKFREDDIDWWVEGVLDELPAEWEWEFHMCCEIDSLWI